MTTCLECQDFEPQYSETEFAAARLKGLNTYLKFKCASYNAKYDTNKTFHVDIEYIIGPHEPENCPRFKEKSMKGIHNLRILNETSFEDFPLKSIEFFSKEAVKEHDALQAKLDELMLEYCPDEMTEAQLANWALHQVKST